MSWIYRCKPFKQVVLKKEEVLVQVNIENHQICPIITANNRYKKYHNPENKYCVLLNSQKNRIYIYVIYLKDFSPSTTVE
jgi:hypothetical protein